MDKNINDFNLNKWSLLFGQFEFRDMVFIFPVICIMILKTIPSEKVTYIILFTFHVLCFFYLKGKHRKVNYLLESGIIIQTKVIEIKKTPKLIRNGWNIYIKSAYFDSSNNKQYLFDYNMKNQNRVIDDVQLEETMKNLKVLTILVESDNYNNYIVIPDKKMFGGKNSIYNIINIGFLLLFWIMYIWFFLLYIFC